MLASYGVYADYDKGLKLYWEGDYKAALAAWAPVAEQGHAKAQHMLGNMYRYRKLNVPGSDKIAYRWYSLAAEQGYVYAQSQLGDLYFEGAGVPKNNRRAAKWYDKSARQGYSIPQVQLARMYQNGEGVFTDFLRAYMWFNLAAYNGYTAINSAKEKLSKSMTRTEISKAQEMSNRCLESDYALC